MNIRAALDQQGIDFEATSHRPVYTSQDLAAEEHVSGYGVAKPVVVRGGESFTMCVLSACDKLDLERCAEILHEPGLRLATEEEMAGLFPDCELGAEPPIGTLFGMETVMDELLREDEYFIMQAGSHTEAIEMLREDWERLCDPIVASISASC